MHRTILNSLKSNQKIPNVSDEALIDSFKETGDVSYFAELYRRFVPLVYGLCLNYLANKEEAHDAVMDIFEKLLVKLPQYEIDNFRTWLYSVAKNHCLQVLRKEKQTVLLKIEDAVMENEDFFTLLDKPRSQEEMAALEHCMKTLPEVQQKSIHFFFIEEKSYADIVALTGFTLNNVKSYIQNGKRNLKSCIIKVLQLT